VELSGRVGLVTGAGAGIGRAVALALARAGASVMAVDLDEAAAEETVALAGAGVAVRADVSRDDELRAAFDAAERLDVLVNNAGGVESPFFPEAPPERWAAVLDVNLRATMLAIQLALERMGDGGAIVNVASVAGIGYEPHRAPEYAAAKAGVVRLTTALAPLAERGVRVSCICPDYVDTPAVRRSLERMSPEERAAVPPLVPAERVADAVLGLVRDESLAGRVLVCPATAEWRLLPADFYAALPPA
jgi:NAD(P)-dependent dehydrogenase (short-subunit alcohol dehydrogenase family)